MKKIFQFITSRPLLIMILIFGVFLITSPGLQNFKLDASSDALVLEGDDDFKIYRETGEIFGNSDFLIITFSPHGDLFSSESLSTIKSLEIELEKISSVESVLSILDAPILISTKILHSNIEIITWP